jgi:phage shock protein A
MADQHLLEKKQKEEEDKAADWMRKAELAVDKGLDDLARAALERHQASLKIVEGYGQQVGDQKIQVETLRSALSRLDQKLGEARAKSDMILAQHRRSRTLNNATDAQLALEGRSPGATFDRIRQKVGRAEAVGQAKTGLLTDDVDRRFEALEKEDEIERMLDSLKARRGSTRSAE